MLYLKIVKLNPDLQIKDTDMFSKNDMFINITYGEQERRTTIKWNNDQPEWGETFIFPINHNLETIKFELFDADNWSECEVIDQEEVDISLDKIKEINTRIFVIEMGNIFYDTEKHAIEIEKQNQLLKKTVSQLTLNKIELNNDLTKLKCELNESQSKNTQLVKKIEDIKNIIN